MIGAAVAGFVLGGGIAAMTGLLSGRRRRRDTTTEPGREAVGSTFRRRHARRGHVLRRGVAEGAYSRIEIWIAAATGIASSAPSTPNSVLPNSTETSTTNGCTATARAWMRGWMTVFSTCW